MSRRVVLAGVPNGALRGAHVLLERSGFETVAASDPESLDRAFDGAPPDLVIVEQAFGPEGGVAACRRIRDRAPHRTVSIMLAVPAGEQHLEECLVAGINDFILTPFPGDELLDKVRRLTAIAARRELNTLVRIAGAGPEGQTLLGKTLNVSPNGILVEIESLLAIGRILEIEFFLPDDPEVVRAMGRVVRRATELVLFHPAFGLRFTTLGERDAARLDGFVARRDGPPLPPEMTA